MSHSRLVTSLPPSLPTAVTLGKWKIIPYRIELLEDFLFRDPEIVVCGYQGTGGVSRLSLPSLIPLPTKFHERVDDWGTDLLRSAQRAARSAPCSCCVFASFSVLALSASFGGWQYKGSAK